MSNIKLFCHARWSDRRTDNSRPGGPTDKTNDICYLCGLKTVFRVVGSRKAGRQHKLSKRSMLLTQINKTIMHMDTHMYTHVASMDQRDNGKQRNLQVLIPMHLGHIKIPLQLPQVLHPLSVTTVVEVMNRACTGQV